ncbi:MAG TPA: ROK family protein [Streptosporangiaceae bacterium]
MTQSGQVLAIDIGGTKLAAGLVAADGDLTNEARVPTPGGADADAEQIWRALDALLDSVLLAAGIAAPAGLAGVGCGSGGPMEWPSGRVSPLNIPGWRRFPLRERLAARFAGLPVRVHNDAICLAAAEHWRGAGRGSRNMLGMVVSTGVGGGLILDGRLIAGASGNAGHIGHVVVEPDTGPRCECGGLGCLEAIARGPALAAWAQAQGWRPGQTGVTARDLAADAALGDPVGQVALRRAGRALGLAITSATLLCDLELISVGGGLAQAGALLFDSLHEAVAEHARLPFARGVRVVPAGLGQSAGLIGAAALIQRPELYWTGD